jgi:hypothetical protein
MRKDLHNQSSSSSVTSMRDIPFASEPITNPDRTPDIVALYDAPTLDIKVIDFIIDFIENSNSN